MEKCFDFEALLHNNQKKHKGKPAQFISVAHGVQKRLESNIKNRRSSRLTLFDRTRNIPTCKSPVKKSEVQLKLEHRKQQLEKWKEEKAKKKKEQAAQKKKPFVVGVASAPIKFVGPPPVPKSSTSRRVTRSQAVRIISKEEEQSSKQRNTKSFAPENASFRPPELKNTVSNLPTLAPMTKPVKSNNQRLNSVTFNPVLPNAKSVKQTRSRTLLNRQTVTEIKKPVKPQIDTRSVKSKVFCNPPPKTNRFTKTRILQSSSSGSDMEAKNKIQSRVQSSSSGNDIKPSKKLTQFTQILTEFNPRANNRKLSGISKKIVHQNSSESDVEPCMKSTKASKTTIYDLTSPEEEPVATKSIKRIQTPGPGRSLMRKTRQMTPKTLVLSSSSEKSSDVECSAQSIRRKSGRTSHISIRDSDICSDSISKSSKSSETVCIASGSADITEEIASDDAKNTPRKSLPSTSYMSVPKSESKSEEKLRSPKSPLTPEQMDLVRKISPCVTLSRGKDNARKEMKWKIDEGLLDGEASDGENVEPFRVQLDSEIKRMTEMCAVWDKISEQTLLPEAAQEQVLAAVGQARLLMSRKLEQFRGLVERCARPEPGTALVTIADLQGFWDMVYMQIENVHMRFKKLEELRARGWVEEQAVEVKRKAGTQLGGKKAARPAALSRLREVIAAARKAKKAHNEGPTLLEAEKTFEGGFFSVRSPVRSPVPSPMRSPAARACAATPLSGSLRRTVVSSEARKNASFMMLRASLLSKFDGITPLELTPVVTPINLDATPGRSILKSAKSDRKSAHKSVKAVLFKSDQDNSFTSADSSEGNKTIVTMEGSFVSAIDGIEEFDAESHGDSFLSALGETNNVRRHVLKRQDAVVRTPSKNKRRSAGMTPRATRKKKHEKFEDEPVNEEDKTPNIGTHRDNVEVGSITKKRQSSRNKKPVTEKEVSEAVADTVVEKVPSTKKKKSTGNLQITEENTPATRQTRSTRKTTIQKEELKNMRDESDQEETKEGGIRTEQKTSPTRKSRSRKTAVHTAEANVLEVLKDEDITNVEQKTPSTRKSRSRKTVVAKTQEIVIEDEVDQIDGQKNPSSRKTRSNRSVAMQNIRQVHEESVHDTEVNEEEREMLEEKVPSTRKKSTRKNVLQEVEINVMEDVTPRKSSARRWSTKNTNRM